MPLPMNAMPPQNPMDDLVSAQMMQQTTGNPNAAVPQARNMGKMSKPAIPKRGAVGGAPSGGTDSGKAMITQIYRQLAAKQGGKKPQASAFVKK